jgi:hypothetical protein
MPAKADLRYPLLIVIAVMLLYGIWPGFPPGHPPKTIVCPPCAFQPLQQIVPDYLTRFIRPGDVAKSKKPEGFWERNELGDGNKFWYGYSI